MSDRKSISVMPAPAQERVLLIVDGKLIAEMPVGVARKVGKLMLSAAKVTENESDPVRLVQLQKDMINMGLPISMSLNPAVHKRANHELANGDMKMGVDYKGVVAKPTITGGD